MIDQPTVLVIGGTGMLGRPVVRRLLQERFAVRALVRDTARAARMLPEQCEFVEADLRDADSIRRAIDGAEVVYLNLSSPYSKRKPDVHVDGCRLIGGIANDAGVKRLMKISALGVVETRGEWWLSDRMMAADEAIMSADVPYTIFRPTWFMESLSLFVSGRRLMLPRTPDDPVYWIAGDDYGVQVAAAIMTEASVNSTYAVQGPEAVSFAEAARRFVAAYESRLKTTQLPMWLIRGVALVWPQAAYLRDLLSMTFKTNTTFHADNTWRELGEPGMPIEQYVTYMQQTGDVPRK